MRRLVAALLATLAVPAAARADVRDLGTVDATSVNSLGMVTGGDDAGAAFRYHRGTFTPLPRLVANRDAYGHSINDKGEIAGSSTRVFGGTGKTRAVWWDANNVIHPLGGGGDYISVAFAIDDAGHITGYTAEHTGSARAFLTTTASAATPLLPGTGREGVDVNAAGTVLGRLGADQSWIVKGGTYSPLDITVQGSSQGLNDAGQIAGVIGTPARAVRRTPGEPDLLLLPTQGNTDSRAASINESGVVVGESWNASFDFEATIWSADGFPTRIGLLMPPGSPALVDAIDISNAGHILVRGEDEHVYLISPPRLTVSSPRVHEPATGSTNATFTLTLAQASSQQVTVDYATADGTAKANSLDYTAASGTLTFLPGETSKTIAVPVHADFAQEDDETFKLLLSNARGAELSATEVTGTILKSPLQVVLKGAGSDPFTDTFAVQAVVTNTGAEPITGLRIVQDLSSSEAVYAPDKRADVVRLAGPEGTLPASLGPGASAAVGWLLQADSPGFVFLTARIAGDVGSAALASGSAVEVKVGEPGPMTLEDLAVLLMGQWLETSGDVQARVGALQNSLANHLGKLKPFGKKSRLKPTAREKRLAAALGLTADSLAWLPDNPKEAGDLLIAVARGREEGKLRALKKELGGAKNALAAAGKFLERWTSADGVAELSATGSELWRMSRNGELTGGWVAEAGKYYGNMSGSPEAAAENQRQLTQIKDEAVAGSKQAFSDGLAAGKKKLKAAEDSLNRDPVAAVRELSAEGSEIETKVQIEVAKEMLGAKLLKSVKLLRRVESAADAVEAIDDAYDAERRAAQIADAVPSGPMTPAQLAARTGMTKEMGERMLGHVAELERRYPGLHIEVSGRPISVGDAAKLKAGYIPKIEAIPIKKVNAIDVEFLGANAKALDEVGYFTPRKPPASVLKALSPTQRADVLHRYELRAMEAKAMAGKSIPDKVLQAKITEMRKALSPRGHVFEETINGKVIRSTEMQIKVKATGGTNLIKNQSLKINGRTVGRRGAGFTGDFDIETVLSGGKDLPAGVRGSIELSLLEALRKDPELPIGFHAWGGFDLTASQKNTMLVISERLSRLKPEDARKQAAFYAAKLGVKPEDLLRTRRNGFIVTFTREGILLTN